MRAYMGECGVCRRTAPNRMNDRAMQRAGWVDLRRVSSGIRSLRNSVLTTPLPNSLEKSNACSNADIEALDLPRHRYIGKVITKFSG